MRLNDLINQLQEIEEDLGEGYNVAIKIYGKERYYDIDTISSLEEVEQDDGVTIVIREVGTF